MKKLLLIIVLVAYGCGKPDSKNLEEKMQRELVVANENTDKKSIQLENELAVKQNFFSSLEGTFEGDLSAGEKIFKTRISLHPSLPPYSSRRVRTIDEVITDLNNLFFSVQTTHWNSKGTAVASGCIFSQVRPDLLTGTITISSEGCGNVYKLSLFSSSILEGKTENIETIKEISKSLSLKVLTGDLRQIDEVYIVVQPTLVAKTFTAKLKRVAP